MATITLKGNPFHTAGDLPQPGTKGPDFRLTGQDLSDLSLDDLSGRRVVLNIFPSIDTPVCAVSVRKFNKMVTGMENVALVCVSRDLPFAHGRFCGAEGIEEARLLSEMRNTAFGEDYGVRIVDGPLAGLFARAVVVMDEDGTVIHSQLVPEIGEEPDYEKVLSLLGGRKAEDPAPMDEPLPACRGVDAESSRTGSTEGPCDDGTSGA